MSDCPYNFAGGVILGGGDDLVRCPEHWSDMSYIYTVALEGVPLAAFPDPSDAMTEAEAKKALDPDQLVTVIVDSLSR